MNSGASVPHIHMPSEGLLDTLCPYCPVPGCAGILARMTRAVFALWEAWEKEAGQECPIPFWAVVWPAARVLARFLLDRRDFVEGKEVIEIGCGGAVASIAAVKAGALMVTANDTDPIALEIARQNSARNGVSLQFECENLIESGWGRQGRVVLLSDFFYEKSKAHVLSRQLAEWRDRTTTILIADGGRSFVPQDYRELLWEQWMDVDSDLEGRERRAVRILRY